MKVVRVLAALAAFFVSGQLLASSVTARDVQDVGWSGNNVIVKYQAKASFAANDPRYKTIPVTYSPAQMVKRAAQAVKDNPGKVAVQAAIVGAVAAAGWAIDELTGQVGQTSELPGYQSGYFWMVGYYEQMAPTVQQLADYYSGTSAERSYSVGEVTGDSACIDMSSTTGDFVPCFFTASKQACGSSVAGYCTGDGSTTNPVSDEALAEVLQDVLSRMSPSELRDFFKNGGYLPELTPELNAALQEWANDLAEETGENLNPEERTAAEEANDYAKEQTLLDVLAELKLDTSVLTSPDPVVMNEPFSELSADIESTTAVLGDAPLIAQLTGIGGSGTCSGIPYDLGDFGSGNFDNHCTYINDWARPAIGFLFAVGTVLYLWSLYRIETTRNLS